MKFEPWFHYEVVNSERDGYPEVRAKAVWHAITWPQSARPVELTEETLPGLIADAADWAQETLISLAGITACPRCSRTSCAS